MINHRLCRNDGHVSDRAIEDVYTRSWGANAMLPCMGEVVSLQDHRPRADPSSVLDGNEMPQKLLP